MPKREPIRIITYQRSDLQYGVFWEWALCGSTREAIGLGRNETKASAIRAARDWIKSLQGRKVIVDEE